MKRELAAGLLLLALIGGAVYNIFYVSTLVLDISRCLTSSQTALSLGDEDKALQSADDALKMWLGTEQYTHIFVRHSEIDATSDAFYDLLQSLSAGEYDGIEQTYSKLQYHLSSIATMEQISLGSIMQYTLTYP